MPGAPSTPSARRDGCLARMQQTGVLTVGDAQLLQAAVEHDQAADAEDVVARLDHLAHAARRHQIAGLTPQSCATRGRSNGTGRAPATARARGMSRW